MMVGEIANSIVNMASRWCCTTCRPAIIRPRWRRIIDDIVTWHTSTSLQILRSWTTFPHWIFSNIGHWTRMVVIMVSSLFLLVINQVIVLSVEKKGTGRPVMVVSRVIEGLHTAWKPTWNWRHFGGRILHFDNFSSSSPS